MTIHVLCTDLDGTLLNEQKEVAPADVAAIHRWQAAGRLFGVTSGRQEAGVARALPDTVRPDFIVCLNGALVIKRNGQRIHRPLTSTMVPRVVKVITQFNIHQIVVTERGVAHPLNVAQGLTDDQDIDKLSVITQDPRVLANLMVVMQQLPVTTVHSDTDYLEVTGPGVTKASGLIIALGSRYTLDQVAAVGDYGNDEAMIKSVGIGYAVANATPRLKAMADRLTVANTDAPISHIVTDLLDGR